ncbi:MAG TPA: hypothetical protein VFU21_14510 [Kofleriaceae bacterium]|nr:hypothetical protein [Kofleriaceae bacterium]
MAERSHLASRAASRIATVAGVVIAAIGLFLLFGPRPATAPEGIGTAVQTILGGVFLVAAGVAGLAAVFLWLVAERRRRGRRLR